MKQLGVNFLVLGCTLILLLVLLEVSVRVLDSPKKEIDKDWVHQFVKCNQDGFRDREILVAKPRDKFRILVVGASQTFGHGIEALEDTIPKQLIKYSTRG